MKEAEKYIWLFGENVGKTANNNSFWMWKYIVQTHDDVDAYFIAEKNAQTLTIFNQLPAQIKPFWIWRNSLRHAWLYNIADMLFVSLSFRDVQPDQLFGKSYQPVTTQPLVYLQHGTLAIKALGYQNFYSNNCLFRFICYNPLIANKLEEINGFKAYQIYNGLFHPRYMELVRRHNQKEKHPGKVFLWFFTWREYLTSERERKQFIRRISLLLQDEKLNQYLAETNSKFRLCLHAKMSSAEAAQIQETVRNNQYFECVSGDKMDVMQELVDADVLITDYSSVGFDFTVLNKPVILYCPDLQKYLSKRKLYCTEEELCQAGYVDRESLVDCIVHEKYEVNSFFRSRMPSEINLDWIAQGGHIERMYQYFWNIQKNSIAFLGYDFTGVGGTVFATKALAEGLLERGYSVRGYTLKRMCDWKTPAGMALRPMTNQYKRRFTERLLQKVVFSERHYRFLDMDPARNAMRPLAGLNMSLLMKRIHAATVISTRESLHFFLNECSSPLVQKKIYFFHTSAEVVDELFPNAMKKLNEMNLPNAVFVSEQNRLALAEKCGFSRYQHYGVIGNALNSSRSVPIEQVNRIESTNTLHGVCLMRLSKERKAEADEIIAFACYLKAHQINDISLDVFGNGDYLDTFEDLILENELESYVCARGGTNNIPMAMARHDFCVDFSRHQSFGMASIESILNGRMIYTYPNEGANEVLFDMPECFFESYPQLIEKIHSLREMPREAFLDRYTRIDQRYGRRSVTEKFIRMFDLQTIADEMGEV